MRRLAALSPRSRLAVALVLALVLGAVLVEAATLPHVHAGSAPGLYNHDHDLTLIARLAGDASPPPRRPPSARAPPRAPRRTPSPPHRVVRLRARPRRAAGPCRPRPIRRPGEGSMRRLIALMCIAAVVLASTPARAQQADAVRREIDDLRRQLA